MNESSYRVMAQSSNVSPLPRKQRTKELLSGGIAPKPITLADELQNPGFSSQNNSQQFDNSQFNTFPSNYT